MEDHKRTDKPEEKQEITTLLKTDPDGTVRALDGKFVKGVAQDTNKNGTAGKPTVMTEEVLNKLTHAFSLGATDVEACAYANISHQTLYNYQHKHPEYVEYKNRQKQLLILKSRQTVIGDLDNPSTAWKYLSKKGIDFQQDSNTYVQFNFLAKDKKDDDKEENKKSYD